jgi:NAD(P)-dependent dehydrogenase (short-subunit alcohol dehydrogenase family)
LVTGSGSGVGLALTHLLLRRGYRVAASARLAALDHLRSLGFAENDRLLLIPLDVTNADERATAVSRVLDTWGRIDAIVNNAAIAYRSTLEQMSEQDELRQMQTNFMGPLGLIRLALPHMRKQRSGWIINVSSVGGMMAMPTMGSYSASKFALEGASEALWYETRPWNIQVVLVQPGFINSNAFRQVTWSDDARRDFADRGPYHQYYVHMSAFVERLMKKAWATPESVARHVVAALEHPNPPLRIPATADAIVFSLIRRALPRRLYHYVLYRSLPGIRCWGVHEDRF